ncbi:acrosin-like [Drosophila eugracilis]|uniref:acrosin-like n=1 Tax=Drosophila eugracilis TaxID=29029 RepID=UPI0007E7647F|nr:acrosin-like [Drosophila eugracilis]
MKTYFAWIPLVALLLGHQAVSQLLDNSCGLGIDINSNKAGLQAAAWMAAIRNDTHFLCGGTLIHSRFVLTTAQCTNNQASLYVKLGAYSTPQLTDKYVSVSQVYLHQSNDIGLLKLSNTDAFNAQVHPICIVTDPNVRRFLEPIRSFKVFDWAPKSNPSEGDYLLGNIYYRLNTNECNSNSSLYPICAGEKNTTQHCGSYSGNPLTTSVKINKNTTLEVQFGIAGNGNCNKPRSFTDITSNVDWIAATINRYNTKDVPETNTQPDTRVPNKGSETPIRRKSDLWLYSDCGGDSITSYLLALISGSSRATSGVFITDKFVIVTASSLPKDTISVSPASINRTLYRSVLVESIFKHPQYTDDQKNDIALIKLKKPVNIGGIKPICMLAQKRHQEEAESNPPFTIFAPTNAYDRKTVREHNVELLKTEGCFGIESNQFCVEASPGITELQNYGFSADIVGKKLMYSGRDWLALFGMVSYSMNDVYVYTNVMRHTEWIASVVNSNQ